MSERGMESRPHRCTMRFSHHTDEHGKKEAVYVCAFAECGRMEFRLV